MASRIALALSDGAPVDGHHVLHSCDNPPCCNPAHLRRGTRSDNMRDAVARGRQVSPMRGRTHCKSGHPFDEKNTYRDPRGWRGCRACRAASQARRQKRG